MTLKVGNTAAFFGAKVYELPQGSVARVGELLPLF
jgi:hypothetical protein